MVKSISDDFRIRVVRAYETSQDSYKTIAKRFDISTISVFRWISLERTHNSVSPRPHGGGQAAKIGNDKLEELKSFVAEQSDRTLVELADKWNQIHGTSVHRSSMSRALQRANITRKKNFSRSRA
jgi:transposase